MLRSSAMPLPAAPGAVLPPGVARPLGGWSGAWKVAVLIFAVIVIRLPELYPRLALVRPTILVVLIALALHASRSQSRAWQAALRDRQLRYAALYVLTAALMVPFALWPGRSLSLVESMPFGLMVILTMVLVPPTRAALDRITFSIATLTTLYAIGVLAYGRAVDGDRLTSGGMHDPNDLAALLLIAMQLALGVVLRKEPAWKRLLSLLCAAVLCYAMARTSSRGGMLALVTGTLVLARALPPRRLAAFALAMVIAAPVLWQTAPAKFRERAESLFALEDDYNTTSTAGRSYLWKRGIAFFVASPVIGAGPGNFEQRLGEDFRQRTGGVGSWHTAHNSYVQVMVELGLAGIVLMGLMLYRAVQTGWQLSRTPKRGLEHRLYRPEILAATVSFMTSAFFLSHGYSFLFFGIVALTALAARVWAAERHGARPAAMPGEPTQVLRRVAGRRGGLSLQPVLDDRAASLLPRR